MQDIIGPTVNSNIKPYIPEIADDDIFGSIIGYGSFQVQKPSVAPFNVAVEDVSLEPKITQSAISGVPEKVSFADSTIEEIDVTLVVPNPYQPRKVFEPDSLKELAESIAEHGVIQPLVVTRVPNGYEIVVGERRFRAAVIAGLSRVPAIVKKEMGDQTKLEVALIENIQRRELNAIEEARAYDRLIKTFGITQEQVAQKVGKSRPAISNTLRLLNLPVDAQRAVIEGKITEGHARALLTLDDTEKQLAFLRAIIEQGWNVRQVEYKVREAVQVKQVDAVAPDPKLVAIESELRDRLGTQVRVQKQGQGGKIMIEFFSEEELQDIMEKLREERQQTEKQNSDEGYLVV
jgi:ParB family chromosome partitioning protein